jgi:YfiH family protein
LHQVHGATVLTVAHPGEHAGADADALVTDVAGCTLAIRTADCAPLVLEGTRSVAVLHLGWRSLAADLVSATVGAMADLDDRPVRAHLGPCIRPECYEFGPDDLATLVDRFGPTVRGRTLAGQSALDLAAGIRVALAEHGVDELHDSGECTACSPGWFSHRARRDEARLATAAWIEA